MEQLSPEEQGRLASRAVRLSFWLGGVILVVIKGVALVISGSSLVKASLFESLSDIMSSAILAVTQMRVQDSRDMHLYPTGKRRLTPLGILFFAAFAMSTMAGLVISNLQALFESDERAEESSAALLRRVFDEQPRLRRSLHPAQLDALITEYADAEAEPGLTGGTLQIMLCLLGLCIIIKSSLLVFCVYAARRAESDIAKTLALDHRNDVLGNCVVVTIVLGSELIRRRYQDVSWLEKVDPTASCLLAAWISYSWLTTAQEQLKVLSDKRAEDEHVEGVVRLLESQLADSPLALAQAETYHIGEGYAATVDLYPKAGTRGSVIEVAAVLDALENALLASDLEVKQAHVRLRQHQAPGSKPARGEKSPDDMSWAANYPNPRK